MSIWYVLQILPSAYCCSIHQLFSINELFGWLKLWHLREVYSITSKWSETSNNFYISLFDLRSMKYWSIIIICTFAVYLYLMEAFYDPIIAYSSYLSMTWPSLWSFIVSEHFSFFQKKPQWFLKIVNHIIFFYFVFRVLIIIAFLFYLIMSDRVVTLVNHKLIGLQ